MAIYQGPGRLFPVLVLDMHQAVKKQLGGCRLYFLAKITPSSASHEKVAYLGPLLSCSNSTITHYDDY